MLAGRSHFATALALAIAMMGCSAPSPAARVPTANESPRAAEPVAAQLQLASVEIAPATEERVLPSACGEGPVCVPPADFAARLCTGTHPEVALHMLAPKTPWKRAYLKRAFKAWYVGGHGDMRELRLNEEVIIIATGRGGEAVKGLGGQAYDVFRWDGTCVSLMDDEISFQKPGGPVPANIAFTKLEPAFRSVFAGEKSVEQAQAAQVRICDAKTAEQEPGKTKCELARRQTSLAIAQSVGRGKELPALSSIP